MTDLTLFVAVGGVAYLALLILMDKKAQATHAEMLKESDELIRQYPDNLEMIDYLHRLSEVSSKRFDIISYFLFGISSIFRIRFIKKEHKKIKQSFSDKQWKAMNLIFAKYYFKKQFFLNPIVTLSVVGVQSAILLAILLSVLIPLSVLFLIGYLIRALFKSAVLVRNTVVNIRFVPNWIFREIKVVTFLRLDGKLEPAQ